MKNLLVAAVSFALTLSAIEGVLRALEFFQARRIQAETPFIRATNVQRVFERATVDGEDLYVRSDLHWIPRWPRFAAVKSPRTFRIFCLGGSAAMGWPHSGELAYPALLERKLSRLYPDLHLEVINAAGNTYASYRVKIVFDEIIDYAPDAVVIYSGNNEFLENVLYPTARVGSTGGRDDGTLGASALGRFVRRRLSGDGSGKRTLDFGSYGNRDQVSNHLSFAFGRASELRTDPRQFMRLRDHYVYNLEQMVQAGRERGVPVVLATVPVNLRDWRPNAALPRQLTPGQRHQVQVELREADASMATGDAQRAADALERALVSDPLDSLAWFDLGSARFALEQYADARAAFRRALELDGYPFRSLFDEEVRRVAERTGAPLADLSAALEREARGGIVGFDLMLDYVHPTVRGNELIAQEVLEALDRGGLLPGPAALPIDAAQLETQEADLDVPSLRALFGQVLIMRQYEALEAVGARLRRALEARAPGLSEREGRWNDDMMCRVERALAVVRPHRELLRAERLGLLEQRFTPEQAEAIFEDYVSLIRELEGDGVDEEEFASHLPERIAR